jgi:hypothetical protein
MFNDIHQTSGHQASQRRDPHTSIGTHRRDSHERFEEGSHRYGGRHGNDRRYRGAAFTAVRAQLGRSYHREAVADVVDVVTGYARSREGLRGEDGRFRPIVVIAVRGVAGGDCDEEQSVAVLEVLEAVYSRF